MEVQQFIVPGAPFSRRGSGTDKGIVGPSRLWGSLWDNLFAVITTGDPRRRRVLKIRVPAASI